MCAPQPTDTNNQTSKASPPHLADAGHQVLGHGQRLLRKAVDKPPGCFFWGGGRGGEAAGGWWLRWGGAASCSGPLRSSAAVDRKQQAAKSAGGHALMWSHRATGVLVPASSSSVVTMPGLRLCMPIFFSPALRSSDCGGAEAKREGGAAQLRPVPRLLPLPAAPSQPAGRPSRLLPPPPTHPPAATWPAAPSRAWWRRRPRSGAWRRRRRLRGGQ